MPELIAKDAYEGRAAVTKAGATLAPVAAGPVWSVALFPGGGAAVAGLLEPLGLAFPGPGQVVEQAGRRLVWTGRDQAFLFGDLPPGLDGAAAVTDQSGGWAGLSLTGPGAVAVLARLVAVDLRPAAFPVGRALRTGLNHMAAILRRSGEEAFEIWVFRSMERTAWHEMAEVLDHLEARAALAG